MNTKERIFETALTLFSEKGVNATSIRDITRATGLTVAAFYNHFKSKDELLQAVYSHYTGLYVGLEKVNPDYDELLDRMDPKQLFAHLTRSYVQSVQNEKLMRLTKIIVMEQYTNKTAGEIAFRDRRRLVAAMEELFAAMGKRGLIKSGDPRSTGALMGYVLLGLASDNIYYKFLAGKEPEEIIKNQLDVINRYLEEIIIAD